MSHLEKVNMVHRNRVTLVTVIVLTFVIRSNSNFSFSNLISNYLTKYPSNVHNRHKKQFNQKPPLPPSHHHQSKVLSEVSRAFQLSPSLSKRNLNNKNVIKSVTQRNPIQQPIRIKLPNIINRQQNVNLRPSKSSNQRPTVSPRNLPQLLNPPKFENRLKEAKQIGNIKKRVPPKFNTLFQTNGPKQNKANERNMINFPLSRNQKMPPLFTDKSSVMQDTRFQGKDKPIFITQQDSGMAQNHKNIVSITKSNKINNFLAHDKFSNRRNVSISNSFAKFPSSYMAGEEPNQFGPQSLLSNSGTFYKEVNVVLFKHFIVVIDIFH